MSRSRCKGRQRLADGLPAHRAQKHSTYSASAPRHCSFENEEACRGLHLHAGLALELCGLVQIRLDLAGGGAGGLVLQTGG
jgi:hypothetical protein